MPPGHYFGGGGGPGGGGGRGGRRDAFPVEGKEHAKPAGFIRLLREAWPFVRPQRWLLRVGFALMAVNRAAGLVAPASLKYLIDDVIGNKNAGLIVPLVLVILSATVVQGITLLFADPASVQKPSATHDCRAAQAGAGAHRPSADYLSRQQQDRGALVSRIMSDVEGLRNLVGTGLVEFAGSLMTVAPSP